jgi:hypothetical protein
MTERYVLLGMARARSDWFSRIGQWSVNGSMPVDFVKCLTVAELEGHLSSRQPGSAVMLDEALACTDRHLLEAAAGAGLAVFVVTRGQGRRPWLDLGAHAVIDEGFGQARLIELLRASATPVGRPEPSGEPTRTEDRQPGGRLLAVCGPGGTGSSVIAAALAQGLARRGFATLLADLARHGEQAMLHDASELGAGLLGLVEAHRRGRLGDGELAPFLVQVPNRGYHLLTGLRRSSAWSALRPRAVAASADTLTAHFDVVVADTDADVEGEAEGGSADVEDRNVLARTSLLGAHGVFVVCAPGVKGVHSLLRVLRDLEVAGVDPGRVRVVANRSPTRRTNRAELMSTIRSLTPGVYAHPPLCVPDTQIEAVLRDCAPFPAAVVDPLAAAAIELLGADDRPGLPAHQGERVVPGSLDSWADPEREALLG